jgi:hypothetical protein
MTRYFSRFQGLSRAESGRKAPVLGEVGNFLFGILMATILYHAMR